MINGRTGLWSIPTLVMNKELPSNLSRESNLWDYKTKFWNFNSHQERIEIRSGQKQQVKEKIFPGYLLIKMILSEQAWLTVRTTNGVTGFIGVGNKPTPLAEEEVEVIQKFVQMKAPKFRAKFTVGEAVKIIDGAFAEFLGTVDSIDEAKGKIKVLVSILVAKPCGVRSSSGGKNLISF